MKTSLFLSALWLVFASLFSHQEKSKICGKISDSEEALIGAQVTLFKDRNVVVKVVSDLEGKYCIEAEPGVYDLEVLYMGYETQRLTDVKLLAGKDLELNFKMESHTMLSEVVITKAYKRKEADDVYGLRVGSSERSRDKSSKASPSAPAGEGALGRAPVEPAVFKPASGEAKPIPTEAPATETHDLNPYRGHAIKNKKLEAEPTDPTIIKDADGRLKKVEVVFEPETYEEKVMLIDIEDGSVYEEPAKEELDLESPGTIKQPRPKAGLLTAGEWNDLHNWNRHWVDLLADGEIASFEKMYGFYAHQRYTVFLTNLNDVPVADAIVQLKSNGSIIWEAHSDNTGKAELWAGLYDQKEYSNLKAEAWINGRKYDLGKPKSAKEGFNFHKIDVPCGAPNNVDIVWAVDATGSMGDEIEYLKTEVLDVISRSKNNNPSLNYRMGTVFYKDKTDDYTVKSSGLSTDINKTVQFIQNQYAGGGGDYPEAVHSALEEAIYRQNWSEHAIARICFLILDASPHEGSEINASLQKSIQEAAKKGIRIVPLGASGIRKDTEFLMKFFGLATNGSYLFLTDHSGIGGKHLEPTSDEYKVEPLNDLFVRIITEYTSVQSCEGKSNIRFEDNQQQDSESAIQATYYPNPAVDQFTIDLPVEVQSITLYDSEGQGVRKLEKPVAGLNSIRVADLPAGFYTIRILNNGRMQSGKLMVVKS
ncbi:MAG: carboxypeptidase regulatory-like domain-containing protein [Saprospiraceae bacterium]